MMLQRERRRDEETAGGSGNPAGSGGAGEARQTAERYYSAVDDAIANALSSNSELFNAQIEQENGQ